MSNGVEMPMLGYGVYQVTPEECTRCVRDAIEVGYRAIDTAQAYSNEAEVGRAIVESGISRQELFITSKIWISNFGQEAAARSIDESLRKLGTDYIDLMLLHQPYNDYYGAYRALEEAYRAGKLRAIGVSNFYPGRLVDLYNFTEVKPMVNQIETHPFFQRDEDHKWMDKYGVAHTSWAPFDEGKKGIFTHPLISSIADKHGKTTGQVILRFLLQNDVILIPKTTHRERMIENMDIFDFTLDADDMARMRTLDEGQSSFFDHNSPEASEMVYGWV